MASARSLDLIFGCAVAFSLAVIGGTVLLGLPGALALSIADASLSAVTGARALRGLGDDAWPLAIALSLLAPVPVVPLFPAIRRGPTWTSKVLRAAATLFLAGVWSIALGVLALVVLSPTG